MTAAWFTLLVALVLAAQTASAQKLHIGIYYESLCPDSVRFIQNHLTPAYESIKNHVDVLFVPFGKSESVNGGESFVCQHGEAECFGNKVQSCTLYALNGYPDDKFKYVSCQMQVPYPTDDGRACAALVNVDYAEVHQCLYGGLATQFQLEAERITHRIARPYPSFVPTIVYNNVFDQTLQDRSVADFAGVVCDLLNNSIPNFCPQ